MLEKNSGKFKVTQERFFDLTSGKPKKTYLNFI